MNEIPDYIANGVAVLVQPYTRELMTTDEVRQALAVFRERPLSLDDLAQANGLTRKALYMRLRRAGCSPVGKNGHRTPMYNPKDVQKVLARIDGDSARATGVAQGIWTRDSNGENE